MNNSGEIFQAVPSEGSRLQISQPSAGITRLSIPREGFSMKGVFILSVIFFWMMMILAWMLLLIPLGWGWALLSVPFWLLSVISLRIAWKMLFSFQSVEVGNGSLTLKKTKGKVTAAAVFSLDEIEAVMLVEGTYRTLAGISRKGIYPAIIRNGEAFSVGERCSRSEKQWIVEVLKRLTLK